MADLVIFGAGDIARLAHYYFTNDSPYNVVGFTVNQDFLEGDNFCGLPLVAFEKLEEFFPPSKVSAFAALSYAKMNQVRTRVYRDLKSRAYKIASYVSSRCTYLSEHRPGENCFILEDNTIQPFVRIGNNVTLWSGNHIGHDSEICDNCFVTSHVVISGNCLIKQSCFIGVNATLRNSLTLGEKTLIGAGALVMKDTPPESVFIPRRTEAAEGKNSGDVNL